MANASPSETRISLGDSKCGTWIRQRKFENLLAAGGHVLGPAVHAAAGQVKRKRVDHDDLAIGEAALKNRLGLLVLLLHDLAHAFVVITLAKNDAVADEEVAVARCGIEVNGALGPRGAIHELAPPISSMKPLYSS